MINSSATRTALRYSLLTGFLILAFDLISDVVVSDKQQFVSLHFLFAIFTVLLLYGLLSRELRKRERVEAQRHSSERRLANLLETAADAIIATGEDYRIIVFNRSAEGMFGYQADEVLGKPLDVLLPLRSIENHRYHFNEFAKSPQTMRRMESSGEVSARRKDGTEFPAEASISKLTHDGQTTFTVVLRDITERKFTEDALRSSEQRFRTLVESINDTVLLIDTQLKPVAVFGGWQPVTGLQPNFVIGKTPREFFGEEAAKIHEDASVRALAGEHVVYSWSVDAPKGSLHFQTSLSPLYNAKKEIEGIVGVTRDVSEQKRLEKYLIQTEKLITVAEMSAMISHEFRNALTSIRLILELQMESQHLSRSEQKSLTVALESIDYMEMIVTQLLSFSRPAPMVFEPVNVSRLIEESLALVWARLTKERILVNKMLDDSLPQLMIDARHFKEVLTNLLLNAIQAIASAGANSQPRVISVITRRHVLDETMQDFIFANMVNHDNVDSSSPKHPSLVMTQGTECALIEICDTGCGIKPENLERIFDPFFTTKSSGTGVGLSLVKRIVNAHHGMVRVKSTAGQVTCFSIYLPIALPSSKSN